MSPNAILEGLQQGNAIELGVLKDIKEGMNAVVDGMISECLNRSDGLAELTEKLQLDKSTAISTATTVSQDQKARLKNTIEDAIRCCETTYKRSLSKVVQQVRQNQKQSDAHLEAHIEDTGRNYEQLSRLWDIAKIANVHLSSEPADQVVGRWAQEFAEVMSAEVDDVERIRIAARKAQEQAAI